MPHIWPSQTDGFCQCPDHINGDTYYSQIDEYVDGTKYLMCLVCFREIEKAGWY